MSTISERVARGVAWLDDNVLGWQNRVDLDRLDLYSKCRCILGQALGDYDDRPDDLWTAEEFGFNAAADVGAARYDEFEVLDAEWRRVITERRAAA